MTTHPHVGVCLHKLFASLEWCLSPSWKMNIFLATIFIGSALRDREIF